jgi:MarR family transcriptional regulator, temperature-dependent positive regulator of motility
MAMTETNLQRSPLHLLHRASQCAENVFRDAVGKTDLTPRQLAVLTAIAQEEGANQTRLVELTGIDRSTLADVVRRLTKNGMVQRRRTKADARAYAVRLTPDGHDFIRDIDPLVAKADQKILEATRGRSGEFFALLKTIADSLNRTSL